MTVDTNYTNLKGVDESTTTEDYGKKDWAKRKSLACILEGMQDLVKCALCLKPYKNPCALKSCGHMFCSKCIIDHLEGNAPSEDEEEEEEAVDGENNFNGNKADDQPSKSTIVKEENKSKKSKLMETNSFQFAVRQSGIHNECTLYTLNELTLFLAHTSDNISTFQMKYKLAFHLR